MSTIVRSVVQEMRQEPTPTSTQENESSEVATQSTISVNQLNSSTINERALSAIIEENRVPSGSSAGKPAQSIAKPLEVGIDAKIKSKIWANEFIELESLR